jgi:hypothetical protein
MPLPELEPLSDGNLDKAGAQDVALRPLLDHMQPSAKGKGSGPSTFLPDERPLTKRLSQDKATE